MMSPAKQRESGFTLLELMISMVILGTILTAIGLAARSSSELYRQSQFEHSLEAQLHWSLEFMAKQFAQANRDLTPEPDSPFGTAALIYSRCEGYDDGIVQWSPPFQIAWQLEEGELDDGLDNNNNGLVDEGVVVWIEDPGLPTERRVVKCHRVSELLQGESFNGADDNGNGLIDEPGLCFEVEGNILTISLTLEGLDHNGRRITKSDSTAVRIRN